MPTIAAFSSQLVAGPAKPVICLDMCDILEIVQCLDWEGQDKNAQRAVTCIEPVRRVLDELVVNPDRVQLVITDLIRTEWIQNIRGIRSKAKKYLSKIDDIFGRPYHAAIAVETKIEVFTPIAPTTLVADLVNLSITFLKQATRLDLEHPLIGRALNRVMTKKRPSHDGHVKDSINFEHYLEFGRQVRCRGLHPADSLREQKPEGLLGRGYWTYPFPASTGNQRSCGANCVLRQFECRIGFPAHLEPAAQLHKPRNPLHTANCFFPLS